MRQDKKLILYMSILFLIVFVTFGVIIVNDKLSFIYIPKVNKKLNNYINERYPNENIKVSKTKYKSGKYYLKAISKENKNLYFYVYYNDRKITDTYESDYKKGNSLINYIEKNLKEEISNKIDKKVSIQMTNTLDNYSMRIRKKIINEEDLVSLKIYNISCELLIDKFNIEKMEETIKNFNNLLSANNIKPRYMNITLTDKTDITKSVTINNLTSQFIIDSSFKHGISDIINKKKSNILDNYNITYKYLN